MIYYKEFDGVPVACSDIIEWAEWFEKADRKVAETWFGKDVRVSTVFLGLDHNFNFLVAGSQPILYETMVFGGPFDQEQKRYRTRSEAEDGHRDMCDVIIREEATK